MDKRSSPSASLLYFLCGLPWAIRAISVLLPAPVIGTPDLIQRLLLLMVLCLIPIGTAALYAFGLLHVVSPRRGVASFLEVFYERRFLSAAFIAALLIPFESLLEGCAWLVAFFTIAACIFEMQLWRHVLPVRPSPWAFWAIFLFAALFFHPVFQGQTISPLSYIYRFPAFAAQGVHQAVAGPLVTDELSQLWSSYYHFFNEVTEAGVFTLADTALFLSGYPDQLMRHSFSPDAWLAVLLGPGWGLTAAFFAKALMAAVFTYLLARAWRASHVASLLAATAFAFSCATLFNLALTGICFLPMLLFLIERCTKRGTVYLVPLLTLAVYLSLCVPRFGWGMLLCSAVFALWRLQAAQKLWAARIRHAGYLFAGLCGALLLLAAAIVPSLGPAVHAGANIAAFTGESLQLNFSPAMPVFPQLDGGPQVNTIYIGIIPLVLFLSALLSRPRRLSISFLAAFSIICMLAFDVGGARNSRVISILGLGDSQLIAGLLTFLLAIGSGAGLDAVLNGSAEKRQILFPILILLLAVLPSTAFFVDPTALQMDSDHPQSGFRFMVQVALILASLLLIGFFSFAREGGGISGKMIVLASFLDLLVVNSPLIPYLPNALNFPQTELISALKSDGQGRSRLVSLDGVFPVHAAKAYGISTIDPANPLPARLREIVEALDARLKSSGNSFSSASFEYNSPLLDLLRVTHIVAPRSVAELIAGKEWKVVLSGGVSVLKRSLQFRPAFLAASSVYEPHPSNAIKRLENMDFEEAVLIEDQRALLPEGPSKGDSLKLDLRRAGEGVYEISVHTERSSYLVLLQPYDPAWRAYVNGEPVPTYIFNYAFLGVPLIEGESTVLLAFQPSFLYVTKTVSLITLAVLCFILAKGYLKRASGGEIGI
ncbi:MAG: YfhO family protein [Deltaproteobacteria bacterium]|nr:YfhO family protein [Deltaproteobacteria bacterium]